MRRNAVVFALAFTLDSNKMDLILPRWSRFYG
jgi:hypothetical protein